MTACRSQLHYLLPTCYQHRCGIKLTHDIRGPPKNSSMSAPEAAIIERVDITFNLLGKLKTTLLSGRHRDQPYSKTK